MNRILMWIQIHPYTYVQTHMRAHALSEMAPSASMSGKTEILAKPGVCSSAKVEQQIFFRTGVKCGNADQADCMWKRMIS